MLGGLATERMTWRPQVFAEPLMPSRAAGLDALRLRLTQRTRPRRVPPTGAGRKGAHEGLLPSVVPAPWCLSRAALADRRRDANLVRGHRHGPEPPPAGRHSPHPRSPLAELAARRGLALEDTEADLLHLDGLEQLLEWPAFEETCSRVLNAWNLYGDVARSFDAIPDDDGEEAQRCYDKLFNGNNLSSIAPAEERCRPYFTEDEQHLIRDILTHGRAILATHL